MIEDMTARKLGPHSQHSHIHNCRRFAAIYAFGPFRLDAQGETLLGAPNLSR